MVRIIQDDGDELTPDPQPPTPAELAAWNAAACSCGSTDDRHYLRCAKWRAVIALKR